MRAAAALAATALGAAPVAGAAGGDVKWSTGAVGACAGGAPHGTSPACIAEAVNTADYTAVLCCAESPAIFGGSFDVYRDFSVNPVKVGLITRIEEQTNRKSYCSAPSGVGSAVLQGHCGCSAGCLMEGQWKDITQLHPAHVSVVMAMGDSITAAFSARSNLDEARDISWSIGKGAKDQLTFPWMLSQYSPLVEGQSTKAVLPKDITKLPHNDYHPKTDHLNVAESSGAAHRGSVEEQWGFLLEQFPNYANFTQRWKVLTIWMAANDVCGQCSGPWDTDPWAAKIDALLANVTSTLTNVYVNIISTLDLSNIARIQRAHTTCNVEHKYVLEECGCIDRGSDKQLAQLDANVHAVNARGHALAQAWQKKLQDSGRKDVWIGTQGFMESIGDILDKSFLSNLDCFHPSTVGHESLAIGLWNSMLCTDDRYGRCGIVFTPEMPVTCPTAGSTFYTGPDIIPGPPPTAPPAPRPPSAV